MVLRFSALVLAAGLLVSIPATGAGSVEAQPKIAISGFGEYQTRKTGKSFSAPKEISGKVDFVSDVRLVKRTTLILGQLGRAFGVEIDLIGFGEAPVRLTIRTVHPPITNPGTGKTTRVSEYHRDVEERRNVYFGHRFTHIWGLAEGEWIEQFIYRGRLLAQKRFRVVIPMN
ncbi:MAG: DUF3859 domain-containing protein [Rhodospirillaceae bacterium]|nr:DUF3859 domain-containing protein [Rhodospirillaceae bacterium]